MGWQARAEKTRAREATMMPGAATAVAVKGWRSWACGPPLRPTTRAARNRSCSCRGCACWWPPPTRPWPVGCWPTSRTPAVAEPVAPSDVDDDVRRRRGATEEGRSGAGWLERLGRVGDRAREQRGDAGVADAGAAGPAGGDVAGVGEVEDVGVGVVEGQAEPAAGEGDERPGAGWSRGW